MLTNCGLSILSVPPPPPHPQTAIFFFFLFFFFLSLSLPPPPPPPPPSSLGWATCVEKYGRVLGQTKLVKLGQQLSNHRIHKRHGGITKRKSEGGREEINITTFFQRTQSYACSSLLAPAFPSPAVSLFFFVFFIIMVFLFLLFSCTRSGASAGRFRCAWAPRATRSPTTATRHARRDRAPHHGS